MNHGLRKGLEDIAWELKCMKNVMTSLWHQQTATGPAVGLDPDAYADEYLSTEECAKRLNVSDQTIRNWIAVGRKTPEKGWVEGVHYVNVAPDDNKKAVIRVPWSRLVYSFSINRQSVTADFYKKRPLYRQVDLTEGVDGSPF